MDINAGDEQGRTAMHMAAERSNLEIMQMLISKHAEVNCKTNLVQFTPLHIACQQLSPDIKVRRYNTRAVIHHTNVSFYLCCAIVQRVSTSKCVMTF